MLIPMPSVEPAAPPVDDVPATAVTTAPAGAVLSVDELTVSFPGGSVPVRNVSIQVKPGEIVGIVGESGSGKTLTAMAIADLLPASARLSATRFALFGEDLAGSATPSGEGCSAGRSPSSTRIRCRR